MSVASRMTVKLVLLSTFTLTLAHLLNVIPSPKQAEIRRKAVICEFLAITSSLLAQHQHDEIIERNFNATVERYPEIVSACIRRESGTVMHQIGDHQAHWQLAADSRSTRNNISVPIQNGDQLWATVELSFEDEKGLVATLHRHPFILLGIVTVILNGLFFRWYLLRAFNYLDPSKSVPTHVRSTLDTFSEGVVVLDNDQRIVLANDKFKQHIGKTDQELLGRGIDDLPWKDVEGSLKTRWQTSETCSGMRLGLQHQDERRTYLVNASAILSSDGERKGTIASFDDITPLEQKREELSEMLAKLQSSKDELKDRNKELQYLATRDPLTGCINRRTFFEMFEKQWTASQRYQRPLTCFMVDIDHFKSVNDNHGHSVGDEVLRRVAGAIQGTAREADIVCRYGGEEFCILLPETDTDEACLAAERIRCAVEQLVFDNLSVTASFGVSSIDFGASDPQELLDQADKCLYVAKRAGRNQVVRWDDVPGDVSEIEDDLDDNVQVPVSKSDDVSIPYPAVASLLSALAYRDAQTAAHSTRVAELCVATAAGLLSVKRTYELEVAALLHDIGKIGVPDSILLKPGPLTPEEWETMELHDRIGVEIVEASFSNQRLVDIMRYHHATFSGSPDTPHFPAGQDIPIGARIVAIADAYDAMVSDRVYRKGRPPEQAFEELRRCAGTQFDPGLVERFISIAREHQSVSLPIGSKQTALQIGLQIERLAQAVDDQDSAGIRALAVRLEQTAARGGIHEIECVAAEIREATDEDTDLYGLLQLVDQLMNLCRSVQNVYVDVPSQARSSTPAV